MGLVVVDLGVNPEDVHDSPNVAGQPPAIQGGSQDKALILIRMKKVSRITKLDCNGTL